MQNLFSNMPRQEMPMGYNHSLSTDFIPDDIKFLIACCQIDPSEEDINFIFSYLLELNSDTPVAKEQVGFNAERLNLNALISLANQHGVLPLVYKTLKKLSHLELNSDTPVIKMKEGYSDDLNATRLTLNAEILTELKAHYMSISQRNMLMTSELIKIMHLLRENHIDALAFKGPALSQMAYGDITLRQFGDLDILIKREDISLMIDLMIKDGYVPQIELGTKMDETFLNALNVIGFYKSTSNILVEVHWELLSKNYAITWNENALWNNKKENVTINHTLMAVLPFEEQVLYLCVHGSKHLFERLEWVCDIDRSIRSHPGIDWQYLLNEADKRGIKRMLFLGLTLCHSFFRLELPALLQENIQQDKTLLKLISKVIESNFSESTQAGKNHHYFMLVWHMRENISDKLRFTWHAFFAPQLDDFNFIKLPKYLVFLYPLVRQFRLLTKYLKP